MEFSESYTPTPEEVKKAEDSMSEKQREESDAREKSFESKRAVEEAVKEKEKLTGDRKKQESMDNEKLAEVRSLLGLEQVNPDSEQIFSSKEGLTDFDTALGELVLEDCPDKIVEQILTHIPEGFSAKDNGLGEIEKSIRIWITESAGNAARHINYRQNEEKDIQYDIKISCGALTEDDKKYLQIGMTDNGIGIKPENLEKIGTEQFTTSDENKEVGGNLHAGGHGHFSVDFKNEIATPRGWEMKIQNRNDGENGAVTFLKIPLKKYEEEKKPETEQFRKTVIEKAEQLGIPVLNEENIDEVLGDIPYFSHAIINNSERLLKILEVGELQSSKKSGISAMTYEIDKLIGMDDNVFFALGKGYIRKDVYGLIFNPEALAKIPNASLVKEDLMAATGDVVEEFLETHKEEMISIINKKRNLLKELFEKRVTSAFQGGHGIYEKYFGDFGQDRIQGFLDAISAKGFSGISAEDEVIDQFTIERDAILGDGIMPIDLRNELMGLLNDKVVKPHTITGENEIKESIFRFWENGKDSYGQFLSKDRNVPEKVTELRIANQLDLKEAIVGIYVPNN